GLAHAHEEVGKTQQIVLLPDVMRVAVALGTFQAQAQKAVRDLHRGLDASAAPLPEKVERLAPGVGLQLRRFGRVLVRERLHLPGPFLFGTALAAGGQEDALGQLIVRRVLPHAGTEPVVTATRLRGLEETVPPVEAARPQNVAELRRPQGRVTGPLEELI